MEWSQAEYLVSTDKSRLSIDVIHAYLSRSYWASGRSRETIAATLKNSLCFGVYHLGQPVEQVGFARAVTDYATMFWLCDVFILEEHRGQGLGKWLVQCILASPPLKGLKAYLATRDAHGLYSQFGFALLPPNLYMQRTP